MTGRSAWAGIPTLAVTWLAFAQALSLSGLAIWVIGASLLAYLVTTALAATRGRLVAYVTTAALTVLVPLLARTLGGDSAGPITRSSLMATGCAAAMGLLLQTRYPATLLAASLILLGGATGLGAAGRAPWLVGAWVVAAGVTLAMLGPYTRTDLADRRRLLPFALLLAGGGLAAVAIIGAATPVLGTPWTIPGAAGTGEPTPDDTSTSTPTEPPATSDANATNEPPPTEAASEPPPPTSTPTEAPPPTATPTEPPPPTSTPTPSSTVDPVDDEVVDATSVVVFIVLLVLLLLILLLLVVLAWQAIVWAQWRRLRGRLRRGDAARRIVGAWTWVRLRRARYDDPLPINVSADVAAETFTGLTDRSLLEVARLTAAVAYDPAATADAADAERAWQAADQAGRPPTGASLRQRWAWGRRRPATVAATLTTPATPTPRTPTKQPAAVR